jgi:hypothetical protein
VFGRGANRRRLGSHPELNRARLAAAGKVIRVVHAAATRCRRSQSSELVLANGADYCSNYLPVARASCAHCPPLCLETVQNVGVNKNGTDNQRWVWDGRGGPGGEKPGAATICSPPGSGRCPPQLENTR